MKEPKVLRLINENIKTCTVLIDGKSYLFSKKVREIVIPRESNVESYLKTRNFVCGELDDKLALQWYRNNNFQESKPELTEEELVERLKDSGYVVYKKK